MAINGRTHDLGKSLTAAEQLLIEQINRARLDPAAEARRYGIDLNEGLKAGTLGTHSRQVLAPNGALNSAAVDHSSWMLKQDTFSHTGKGGSSATERIDAAGFDLRSPWQAAENISRRGTTGTLDLVYEAGDHHRGLFQSAGHRENILADTMRQVGVGQVAGTFTNNKIAYNTSMLTVDFARSGGSVFLTGVMYRDRDGDDFYSVGEGRDGIRVSVDGRSTKSLDAGGYWVRLNSSGWETATLSWGSHKAKVDVNFRIGNVKLDLIGDKLLKTSASLDIVSGIPNATLLGVMDRSLEGSAAGNVLTGNKGDNAIKGKAGNDTLRGNGGSDDLSGGDGGDALWGGAGKDRLEGGRGSDRLFGQDGSDKLEGGKGNDRMTGGSGNDRMSGGDGQDTLKGGSGTDRLDGGSGRDVLSGGSGKDKLSGGRHGDRITGGDGHDRIDGGRGNDTLDGGTGLDRIDGGGGDDTISGNGRGDHLFGDDGNDWLKGGAGYDKLFGGPGRDRLTGEYGNDWLNGGAGNDQLTGGAGDDRFVFKGNFGRDRIGDFSGKDRIVMGAAGEVSDYESFLKAARQDGTDVVYDLDDDGLNVIVLEDQRLNALKASDFEFI